MISPINSATSSGVNSIAFSLTVISNRHQLGTASAPTNVNTCTPRSAINEVMAFGDRDRVVPEGRHPQHGQTDINREGVSNAPNHGSLRVGIRADRTRTGQPTRGDGTGNGMVIQIFDCNGGDNQEWEQVNVNGVNSFKNPWTVRAPF